MRTLVPLSFLLAGVSLFSLLLAENAYAYLDPGTGSYILQLLVAGVIGGLFTIRAFWGKITVFLRNSFGAKRNAHKGDG